MIKVWDLQPIKASAVEMWSAALNNFKLLPKQAFCSDCLKLQHNFSAWYAQNLHLMSRSERSQIRQRVWQSPLAVERGGSPSPLNKEVGWEIFISLTPSCPEVLEPCDCPLLCMVSVMLAALSSVPWDLECDWDKSTKSL